MSIELSDADRDAITAAMHRQFPGLEQAYRAGMIAGIERALSAIKGQHLIDPHGVEEKAYEEGLADCDSLIRALLK